MMIALVAMVMMTMSASAQSENNGKPVTFDRMSNFLELRSDQIEPVKTAIAQFNSSMESYYQLKDSLKAGLAWEKIQERHKKTMKKVLDEKQYEKYVNMLNLTVKNAAERMMQDATASK